MSYTLLVQNVDGARVDGAWGMKPTEDELRYCVGGQWDKKEEDELIKELLSTGQHDMNDGSCTSYELS